MKDKYKRAIDSKVEIAHLMLPSYSNFSGKIHGGYLLSMMDQIAFTCASKHSEKYCVTAAVNRVGFLAPVEVGDLLTMKAQVNYVGNSSLVVGIKVESENIKTGKIVHCNSSYFTMIAKNDEGKPTTVPGLILESSDHVRRFLRAVRVIEALKERKDKFSKQMEEEFIQPEKLEKLKEFRVKLEL